MKNRYHKFYCMLLHAGCLQVWFFGVPDLPSRPELLLTSPLVYAVRLGRLSCVETLLRLSATTNIPDGHGHTPIQYALLHLMRYVISAAAPHEVRDEPCCTL